MCNAVDVGWKLCKTVWVFAWLVVATGIALFLIGANDYRKQAMAYACTGRLIDVDPSGTLSRHGNYPPDLRSTWDRWVFAHGMSTPWVANVAPDGLDADWAGIINVPACETEIQLNGESHPRPF